MPLSRAERAAARQGDPPGGAAPRARGLEAGAPDRPDPIALLEAQNRTRLPEYVPIRFGRMLTSPFAFLRGSAVVMAHDLAGSPVSGITVQACGDAHVLNFGIFSCGI